MGAGRGRHWRQLSLTSHNFAKSIVAFSASKFAQTWEMRTLASRWYLLPPTCTGTLQKQTYIIIIINNNNNNNNNNNSSSSSSSIKLHWVLASASSYSQQRLWTCSPISPGVAPVPTDQSPDQVFALRVHCLMFPERRNTHVMYFCRMWWVIYGYRAVRSIQGTYAPCIRPTCWNSPPPSPALKAAPSVDSVKRTSSN